MKHTQWDWSLIAKRFKERRNVFGWTIDEAAERAGVSRDTVMRTEKGKPCSDKSLHALRSIYALFSAHLVHHQAESEHYSVCHANEIRWMAATNRDHNGKLVKDIDYKFVDDPDERHRRATLGYQRFFTGFIRTELDGSTMCCGLMEIYQSSWIDQHFGDEMIFCLSGEAVITVEGDACHLKSGDTMLFDASKPHSYAPAADSILPAVIFFVVGTRDDEAHRIANQLPKREKWGV